MKPAGILDRIPIVPKVGLVLLALYVFLVGIGSMSAAFKMMGAGTTQSLLSNPGGPFVSLFIGILATTLVQSSSTTTSLVVGLVAAGAIPLHSAVFMVMGANVGTTVTNTIVSLGHVTRSNEYRRAFAAATVHDFFNLIVLTILFPLEYFTGALNWLALGCTSAFQGAGGAHLANPIKAITKPAIGVLRDAVNAVTEGHGGVILLILAIVLIFGSLIALVRTLKSIMVSKLEHLFDRLLFKTARRGLIFGLLLTVLVQSSSITTSVAVPLVGAGIISIRQVLPYTMGANVGTTVTALLASMAALAAAGTGEVDQAMLGVQLAFHHVLFNVLGVALLWNFRRFPIAMAVGFARIALRNRLIPLFYILLAFYVAPFLIVWFGR